MKYRTILVLFSFACLFLADTRAQTPEKDTPQRVIITGHYSVDIDYPNIFKWFGAKLLGLEPDELVFTETTTTLNDSEISFSMSLVADQKDLWFYISSDTTVPSFTRLPREPRKEFKADAIQFFKKMRAFFHNDSLFYMDGFLTMDTAKTFAFFYEHGSITIPDSEKIKINVGRKRYIGAHTEHATGNRQTYINGDIVLSRKGDCIVYPYVTAYIFTQNLKVQIYLKSLRIEYLN